MAISSQTVSIRYSGNNSTVTAYAVPFLFLTASDVKVSVVDIDGVETILTYGSGYAVTGAGNPAGGAVTTTTAIPATSTVTIFRGMAALQPYSYEEGQRLRMKGVEANFDHLTLPVQQLQASVPAGKKALVFPSSDNPSATLPPAEVRKGTFLYFDPAGGDPVVMTQPELVDLLAPDLAGNDGEQGPPGETGPQGPPNAPALELTSPPVNASPELAAYDSFEVTGVPSPGDLFIFNFDTFTFIASETGIATDVVCGVSQAAAAANLLAKFNAHVSGVTMTAPTSTEIMMTSDTPGSGANGVSWETSGGYTDIPSGALHDGSDEIAGNVADEVGQLAKVDDGDEITWWKAATAAPDSTTWMKESAGVTDAGELTGTLPPERIADESLPIAKTGGLQTALDAKAGDPLAATVISGITGLVAWFRAEDVTGVANGAVVTSWPDASGNGHTAAQSDVTKKPTLLVDAFNRKSAIRFDGVNDFMETNSVFVGTETEATAFLVATKRTSSLGISMAIAGLTAAVDTSRWWMGGSNFAINQATHGQGHFGLPGATTVKPYVHGYTISAAGVRRGFVNGHLAHKDTAVGSSGLQGVMRLGTSIGGSYPSDADVFECIVYNRQLTDIEIDAVNNHLIAKYRRDALPVYVLGDSFTAGTGATGGETLSKQIGDRLPNGTIVSAWGISGRAASTVNATDLAFVLPFQVHPRGNAPVVVVFLATNDLRGGAAAATVLADVKGICVRLKDIGYKVVFATPTPSNASGAVETQRLAFIALVLADPSFADAIADCGNDIIMGNVGNVGNVTYFVDGLHPTNLGYGILANIITSAINRCASKATGSANPSIRSQPGSVDFGSTANGATATATITVTGVSATNLPAVLISGDMPTNWSLVRGYVSGANTVTVVGRNDSGSTNDPSAVILRATVLDF